MNLPSGPELIIILIVIIILFGAKRLPELGKSLGQGIKEFRKSTKGIVDGDDDDTKSEKSDKTDNTPSA